MNIKTFTILACAFINAGYVYSQSDEYTKHKERQIASPSPFQRELDGKAPGRILYQDSMVMALDGFPAVLQTPVHILIIPKKRIVTLNDMTEDDRPIIAQMIFVAQKLAQEKGIDKTGYRLAFNTNEDAGQSAFHLHLHLLGGVKTGPMVDQGWRNIQRAKRIDADSTYATPATKDELLNKLLGSWKGKGATAPQVLITMIWEPAIQFQFIKLTHTIEQIIQDKPQRSEFTKFFRPTSSNKYKATQLTDSGMIYAMSASSETHSLTATWTTKSERLKITYTLTSQNTLEVKEYLMNATAQWKETSSYILQRVF
jgi:histidine triad (HIT) family protein